MIICLLHQLILTNHRLLKFQPISITKCQPGQYQVATWLLTLRALMSTAVDISVFLLPHVYPLKYAFNLETLIYIGT